MTSKALNFNPATLVLLLRIALPMVVSQGAFAGMIFTDRYFLSQLSPTHMASALGAGVAFFFTISLFNGVLAYANALVAQYLGAREYHKCSLVVTQGVIMSVACAPILLALTFVMRGLFTWMGHAPEQAALEETYYTIMMGCSVLVLLKVCFASFFAGTARTHVVMFCDVAGLLFNVPLTWALIFGHAGLPALGIAGAAIATVISTLFTLLLYLAFYLHKSNRERFEVARSLHWSRAIATRYLKLGLPSGAEMFLNVAAFNLFLLMFQSYGIAEAASAAIVFNWDILSFVPMLGLNIAVMSMIGHCVGANDMAKAAEVTTSGYILGLGYSLLLATLFILFRHEMVEVFIVSGADAGAIRALATFMMVGLSTYVLAEGVLQVAAGVLRGAGDTRWVMKASVSLHWAMLVAQFFIIKVLGFGPKVSWVTFVCMILAIAVVYIRRLHGNRWRDPDRLRQVMAE